MNLKYLFPKFELYILKGNTEFISQGYFSDKQDNVAIPIVNNIPYFIEKTECSEISILEKIKTLHNTITSTEDEYKEFIYKKNRRPLYDLYASFQPFNEATKALYPFVQHLKSILKPGDIILDLWNRTGWSAAMLNALFPEQIIISVWNNNNDVLGYRGFNFWFAKENVPENIQIIFHEIDKPFPFENEHIKFIYTHDVLHHFDLTVLLPELLRINSKDGAIISAHTHLSNNEPEPFFDRGGNRIHGAAYIQMFNLLLKNNSTKTGIVLSEPALFWFNEKGKEGEMKIQSTPDMADYNGLLGIIPVDWLTIPLTKFNYTSTKGNKSNYALINPLFKIDYGQQKAIISQKHKFGGIITLLDRHPIYNNHIHNSEDIELSEDDIKFIYWANKLKSLHWIQQKLNITEIEFDALLHHLCNADIVQILPVQENLLRLQHYLGEQEYIIPEKKQTLSALWKTAKEKYRQNPLIISVEDECEYTYEDVHVIISQTRAALKKNAIKKSDSVLIYGDLHIEQLFLFWACVLEGIIVVPINPHTPKQELDYILKDTNSKLIFTNNNNASSFTTKNTQIIILADEENQSENNQHLCFSEWIASEDSIELNDEDISTTDVAVILYTSGSTGTPKGVVLTHGNIFRSSRNITETFHWTQKDIYLANADLYSMSGLRNTVAAILETGTAVCIPFSRSNILALTEEIEKNKITIISSTPSFLKAALDVSKKIKNQLGTLKYIMCTGADLTDHLKNTFETTFSIPVYNYYGLTETSGICISQNKQNTTATGSNIGIPVDSIVQIVNEKSVICKLNEMGQLRIYSENIMQEYLNQKELTASLFVNGWLYTGDTGKYTSDGSIELTGRIKDCIKLHNGDLVYPSEIENCILEIDAIRETAVSKQVIDELETMVAYISVKDGTQLGIADVKEYLLTKLGKYKTPSFIIKVNELPKNTNGKIIKSKLQAINENNN